MKKFYAALALCLFLSSCNGDWDPFSLLAEQYYFVDVTLLNNSETIISYVVSDLYPDTTLTSVNPKHFYPIKPGGASKINLNATISTPFRWERTFPHDTLILFVFDHEIVKNCSWDSIRGDYMILRRYDLSQHDLDSMNWVITYP